MNSNRRNFYKRVINALNNRLENIKETAFYVSPLWQMLEKCRDHGSFLQDVDEYKCIYLDFIDSNTIIVAFDNPGIIKKYIIKFEQVGDYKGFCECEPGMDGFNEEHQCCGHDCDWEIPAIKIDEMITNPTYMWEGDQSTYWEFEKEFLKEHKEQEILLINDLLEEAEDDLASANAEVEKLKRRKEELEHGAVH